MGLRWWSLFKGYQRRLLTYTRAYTRTAGAVAVTTPAITPPMTTLWTAENRPPAATLPMSAYIPSAIEPNGSERFHEVNAYIQSQFKFVHADSMQTLCRHVPATFNCDDKYSPSLLFVMTIDDTATHTKLEVCPLYRA